MQFAAWAAVLMICAAWCVSAMAAGGDLPTSTSAELWAQFVKAPYTHPNIPNVSFAGYRFSESPLPEPKVVANVKSEGAKGDGKTDDIAAFRAAIDKARSAGGGAILVPAGEYKLTDRLMLDASGLVLRGEGQDKTILAFTKPISQVAKVNGSWYGGLVWIEPKSDSLIARHIAIKDTVAITKPARMGDFTVQVDPQSAKALAACVGKMVQVTWTGDLSLCMHIAGHESMKAYDWSSWAAFRGGQLTWIWANQIEKVEGATVTFKKPLRLDIQPNWRVTIATVSPYITQTGVEKLTIRFPVTKKAAHLTEPGYNGVMLARAAHCFVRDITVENADDGIIFGTEAINNTVTGFRLIGRENHHALMMRDLSHDNLIQSFRIESKPQHGLNTEGTSSGNVWRDGVMLDGTFDSHCMMSFDSVRTNITLANSGNPGGATNAGPFVGRRMTHWNIRVTNNKGVWVASPAQLSSGAIVGIQGAALDLKDTGLWHMPDGLNKGTIIADLGKAPEPADLFEAQLKLRLGKR